MWVLSLRVDNTLGQTTTGVCEGWHASLKGWVESFLPRMHQRRLDATVHLLLTTVQEEMQMRDLRLLQGSVYLSWANHCHPMHASFGKPLDVHRIVKSIYI
jgi:hypothetical protein